MRRIGFMRDAGLVQSELGSRRVKSGSFVPWFEDSDGNRLSLSEP